MALEYFTGTSRGLIGILQRIVGADGRTNGGVIPAVTVVPSSVQSGQVGTAGNAFDAAALSGVSFQVAGLSGGDTIAVTRSVDGTNYSAVSGIYEADYSTVATISQDGIYDFPGGGSLKYTKTGTASTPTVTLRAGA